MLDARLLMVMKVGMSPCRTLHEFIVGDIDFGASTIDRLLGSFVMRCWLKWQFEYHHLTYRTVRHTGNHDADHAFTPIWCLFEYLSGFL